ncbi:MAG: 4Fe-4S binding protein [Firmicutes bacterium]|nr:4Fe-4S binding protein [Bacillota bacterium]
MQTFIISDKDYWVDDKCNNCRTCERICPRSNITIKEGRPVWNHDCELCFACIQWCPQEAIQYQNGTQGSGRSHHPEVKLADILSR